MIFLIPLILITKIFKNIIKKFVNLIKILLTYKNNQTHKITMIKLILTVYLSTIVEKKSHRLVRIRVLIVVKRWNNF
jgi:hypothetical protein